MKLTFTVTAVRDVVRLREFIRAKNPQAAQKESSQLKQNIQALVGQPKMGAPLDGLEDFRELVARDYIVRYRLMPNEIVILKIWHGKETR
jgi:plasmid stabilization system protein ParE